jgi:hypothetical protein
MFRRLVLGGLSQLIGDERRQIDRPTANRDMD